MKYGNTYYDPSYGVQYSAAAALQANLDGYGFFDHDDNGKRFSTGPRCLLVLLWLFLHLFHRAGMQPIKHNPWFVAMFVLMFCVFQNYVVIGRQDARLLNQRRISDRSALARHDSWIDVTVDLIMPRTSAGPTRVEHVSARTVEYAPTGTPQAPATRATPLVAVADPRTGFTYITRGNQTFYVSEESDIVACFMYANTINFGRSYIKVPSSHSGADAAIGRFVAEIPDERLMNEVWSDSRVVLQPAAPSDFFALGSQPVSATITSFDVADEILRLDMKSPGDRHTGSFWIDLGAIKLVRVVIDGKETFNAR